MSIKDVTNQKNKNTDISEGYLPGGIENTMKQGAVELRHFKDKTFKIPYFLRVEGTVQGHSLKEKKHKQFSISSIFFSSKYEFVKTGGIVLNAW